MGGDLRDGTTWSEFSPEGLPVISEYLCAGPAPDALADKGFRSKFLR